MGADFFTRRAFLSLSAATTMIAAATTGPARNVGGKTKDQKTAPSASKPKGVVKLAIVGTGQISHKFLKQAAGSQRARFVATCARTMSSAKTRAEEYGIHKWFDDYEVMYDTVKPDAVIIATPNSLHATQAIAAFDRGIHVLCEKPMATTFEDCEAMVAASKKRGTVFFALPFYGSPLAQSTLNYLNEATLGVFTGAEAQINLTGHPRANWFYDKGTAGGVMLDTMVYPVARLIGMLGPAKRVTGFVNTLIPHRIVGDRIVESTIDDNVSLVIEWENGQQGVLRSLWGTSMTRFDAFVYGRRGTLITNVFGGSGAVIHSPGRPVENAERTTCYGNEDCYRVAGKPVPNTTGDGLIDHFVDCIQTGAEPTCSGPQQLHVHEILFKGYEAARTGRAQELKTTFTPWHKIDPAFHDTRSRPI